MTAKYIVITARVRVEDSDDASMVWLEEEMRDYINRMDELTYDDNIMVTNIKMEDVD